MTKPYTPKLRIAVLASGTGLTLQALIDACSSGALAGEMVLLISNNRESGAMHRAATARIPRVHLSAATHPATAELDAALVAALVETRPDVVVLAGYMKMLGPLMLAAFNGRMINTHPALLPKFGGAGMYDRHVHAAVLAAGDAISGATVHFVEGGYDSGRLIARAEVSVLQDDDIDSLSERVKAAERPLLVTVLQHRAEFGRFKELQV